jgi:ADP-heptose:LPS heptosyltransferase
MSGDDRLAPGLLSRLPQPIDKVVLLRASRVGDFICGTPALRALHSALPGAEITMISLPLLREVVDRSPHVDRFVAFPGYPGIAEQLFDPRTVAEFFSAMQRERFDLAIQMQGSGANSNPFTLMLGAQATAGFIRPHDGPGLLDAALPYPEGVHEVRRLLALSHFLGAPACGLETEFALWPRDHAEAARLLAGTVQPLIGLHPFARDDTRRWPLERFVEVAHRLHARYGGTLVLLGDKLDAEVVDRASAALARAALNLVGRTSLATLGAVMARLSLLVTNDSGPAHIAYALGTPTVTIFGGSNPAGYGPLHDGPIAVVAYPVACRPPGASTCARCDIGLACLRGVSADRVLARAQMLLESSNGLTISATEKEDARYDAYV